MKINEKAHALIPFREKMESLSPVSDEDFDVFKSVMHEKFFNKGEVILQEGQVCRAYYFIVEGCIRSFALQEGKEVNVSFYFESDTACDFKSFRTEEPSSFYLIAMEDCKVLYATKKEAVPAFLKTVSLHLLIFRFFQHLFFEEENQSNGFKLLTPEERYNFILESKPHYIQRIPLIHLASYLGISRETLNRIRKK